MIDQDGMLHAVDQRIERKDVEGTWQSGAPQAVGMRHHPSAGIGWKSSSPVNRFDIAAGRNLVKAAGAPAFVVTYNLPSESRAFVRSLTAYAADHADRPRLVA
jgi:hypothetical protein